MTYPLGYEEEEDLFSETAIQHEPDPNQNELDYHMNQFPPGYEISGDAVAYPGLELPETILSSAFNTELSNIEDLYPVENNQAIYSEPWALEEGISPSDSDDIMGQYPVYFPHLTPLDYPSLDENIADFTDTLTIPSDAMFLEAANHPGENMIPFPSQSEYKRRVTISNGDEIEIDLTKCYKCGDCERLTGRELKRHKRVHHPLSIESAKAQCDVCEKWFERSDYVKRHKKRAHRDSK